MISTPGAVFADVNAFPARLKIFSEVMRFAQRTLAECTHFSVRAARRNSGKFAILSHDFGLKLRDLDTGRALFRM